MKDRDKPFTYIIKDGKVTPCYDTMEWGKWMEANDRRLALTSTGKSEVSTVFLGVDHGFGGDEPVVFETLVFGGPLDQEQERYTSREAALEGHIDMVNRVLKHESTD